MPKVYIVKPSENGYFVQEEKNLLAISCKTLYFLLFFYFCFPDSGGLQHGWMADASCCNSTSR